ncbi:zinc ribbon domain-containing protein [Candidatus Micrarchaeota archaeon]|nr:zinc ribbon domain-containing protein [Candidatus Micrarchaeota archaeon]
MAELDIVAALAYYLFIILGSITPGYLAVRYTYPDVRTFSQEEKLGASVLLGAFVAVLAILADVVSTGLDAVFRGQGYWPAFWLSASGLSFVVMFVGLRKSDKPEVAVPATKRLALLQKELESLEQKPPGDNEMAAKMDALRKKGILSDAIGSSASDSGTADPSFVSGPAVTQNVKEAKRVLEQARETEVEAILTDLQLDYPAALSASPDAGRHRRLYLASRQKPQESEEKQIVDDVYLSFHDAADANKKKDEARSQKTPDLLKDENPTKSVVPASKSIPAANVVPAKAGSVSMADLFGESPSKAYSTTSPKSVFAQLDKEVTSVPIAIPPICPTCHQKNSRIVFCPYCGTGMCANCSPKVTPGPDGFTYACPKCQEDIPVKKKQAPV